MARIILTTDAWYPQVNGVVRTIDMTARTLRDFGHTVEIIEPTGLLKVSIPFYPEITICFPRTGPLSKRILKFKPDHIQDIADHLVQPQSGILREFEILVQFRSRILPKLTPA